MIMVSVADNKERLSLTFNLWNKSFSFSAYKYLIFDDKLILKAYWNTFVKTILGTTLKVIVTIMAAYPIAKRKLPGRYFITVIYLITMFFSGGLIPNYLLVKSLHLTNTIWALVLPGLIDVSYIVLMRNFMMAMSPSLEEAALIEGAGHIKILFKIVVPLSTPIIATVALWCAVQQWNAWFDALIYTTGDKLIVLQIMIRRMMELLNEDAIMLNLFNNKYADAVQAQNVQAAVTLLTIGPIVFIYPFIQKYFVKGIMIGSLKG
jgi:putative aldouronate transport system permease protein